MTSCKLRAVMDRWVNTAGWYFGKGGFHHIELFCSLLHCSALPRLGLSLFSVVGILGHKAT